MSDSITNKEAITCEICLSNLSEGDTTHPLICPTSCGFNMCHLCIQHLLQTSQSNYSEASDGSNQVKIKLQCPKCRGNIAPTIRDTLLLRREFNVQTLRGMSDSDLNGEELREKYAVTAEEAMGARLRIEKYLADIANGNGTRNSNNNDNANTTTVVRLRAPSPSEIDSMMIDTSLLFGLDEVMTEAEKIYVTQLMTSGSANKLAQAAQILSEMGHALQKGFYPGSDSNTNNKNNNNRTASNTDNKSEAEKKALEMAIEPGLVTEHTLAQQRIAKHRQMHPLPDRMPRYVILTADFDVYAKHSKVLKFVDDDWNGSIADAFSRVQLTEKSRREEEEDEALFASDDEGEVDDFVNENKKKFKNRVLIKAARRQAARLGIQTGDVVSHVNGDEFKGKAEDLRAMIHNFYQTGHKEYTFSLTLNAEQGTAAALKLRAMVELQLHETSDFV